VSCHWVFSFIIYRCMEIITLGNELPRKKTDDIINIHDETAALAANLMETMRIGKGIGLAAPQVGLL